MSNTIKKIFIGLFLLICSITLVGCKKDGYKYPSKTPALSNATETFVGNAPQQFSKRLCPTREATAYATALHTASRS